MLQEGFAELSKAAGTWYLLICLVEARTHECIEAMNIASHPKGGDLERGCNHSTFR